jgi:hypothetical protein
VLPQILPFSSDDVLLASSSEASFVLMIGTRWGGLEVVAITATTKTNVKLAPGVVRQRRNLLIVKRLGQPRAARSSWLATKTR